MTRPIPPAKFDPVAKAKMAEKFKDLKAAEQPTRDPACICRWHSPEAGIEVRIATSSNCTVHNNAPLAEPGDM